MRRLSVLLLLPLIAACNDEVTDPVYPAEVTVIASATNQFQPPQTSIREGGTVTWNFQARHSIDFETQTGAPDDIQETPDGATDFRVFPTAGVYRYNCTVTGHTEFGIVNVFEQ